MRLIATFCIVLILFVQPVMTPPNTLGSDIALLLAQFDIPGAAVAVVRGDAVVMLRGFGLRDVATGDAVTPDTLFMMGSAVKPMTALLVALAVEEGVMGWDTRVAEALPGFALSDIEHAAQLRIRDLLGHASGVPRHDLPLLLAAMNPDDVLLTLADLPVSTADPPRFAYNNQLVAAAGWAAAHRMTPDLDLNAAYRAHMQRRIFDPLGMARTGFAFDTALADADRAVPYVTSADHHWLPVPPDFERFTGSALPSLGGWSTAADLALFVQLQLRGGTSASGTRIIPHSALEALRAPRAAVNETTRYGLGWFVGTFHGQPLIYHGGNTGGFTSEMALLPQADLGIVVLANRANATAFTAAVRETVFETLLGRHTSPTPGERYLNIQTALEMQAARQIQRYNLMDHNAADPSSAAGTYTYGVQVSGDGVLWGDFFALRLYPAEGGIFVGRNPVAGDFRIDVQDDALRISPLLDPAQVLLLRRCAACGEGHVPSPLATRDYD